MQQCPCEIKEMPRLAFGQAILFGCVRPAELMKDAMVVEKSCEFCTCKLSAAVRAEMLWCSRELILYHAKKGFKAGEGFILCMHKINPAKSRKIIDENYIIAKII